METVISYENANFKQTILYDNLEQLWQCLLVILVRHSVGGPQLLYVGVVGLQEGRGGGRAVLCQVSVEGHAILAVALEETCSTIFSTAKILYKSSGIVYI